MTTFTLLYGDKLSITPDQKIIPAKDFSTLLTAKKLLKQIKEEAARYREEVAAECEALKEQAQAEGFAEGLDTFSDRIAALEQEIEKVHSEVSAKALPIALKAAEKIVGREMTLNDETIADIVRGSLRAVTDHKRITIYCHKDDYDNLMKKKEELKAPFDRLESLVIQDRDDVQQGGCIIETEAGIINAQWENQWQALERAFRKVLGEEAS